MENERFNENMAKLRSAVMSKTELVSFVEESIRWVEKQTDWTQDMVAQRLQVLTM